MLINTHLVPEVPSVPLAEWLTELTNLGQLPLPAICGNVDINAPILFFFKYPFDRRSLT